MSDPEILGTQEFASIHEGVNRAKGARGMMRVNDTKGTKWAKGTDSVWMQSGITKIGSMDISMFQ